MEEGVHACGKSGNSPNYPVPSLTIGGSLDGVVRVTRIAEAWYTQQSTSIHEVALVEGMNHYDVFTGSSNEADAGRDFPSEIGSEQAQKQVASLLANFFARPGGSKPASPAAFFQPFVDMYVGQEGSWWWTGNSDENGASPWAADAQRLMVEPLPSATKWQVHNDFFMLSDEDKIPPYYRDKHRPNVTLDSNGVLHGTTVAQLRYTELTPGQTGFGTNGWEIVKEEKTAVIRDVPDDGRDFTSAIEIATKLASRQLGWSQLGVDSPDSLDDGDRCKMINQAAYDLALKSASSEARNRFNSAGRPMKMVTDTKPFPPAGPWWIWNYLQFNDKGSAVEVSSYYAFYSLSAPAYGAGNHYCKLLSPARALEWIYVDSLRADNMQTITV